MDAGCDVTLPDESELGSEQSLETVELDAGSWLVVRVPVE